MLRSRIQSRDNELHQEWSAIPITADAATDPRVEGAWVVVERSRRVLAMIVDTNGTVDDAFASEDRLTHMLLDIADAFDTTGAPLWVNRTALLDDDGTLPPEWMDGEPTEVRAGTTALALGWGNNTATGWPTGPMGDPNVPGDRHVLAWQVIRGLVDAQVLWCELEELSEVSAVVVTDLSASGTPRERSRIFRELVRRNEALNVDLARHHLAYDDLLLGLQGPRRATAEGSLRAWGYTGVQQRIVRRLTEIRHNVDDLRTERERRYQRIVEGVLTVLSILTLVDLLLSILTVAITGTGTVPGAGSPLGIFDALRHLDGDVYLMFGLFASAMVLLALAIARRRA